MNLRPMKPCALIKGIKWLKNHISRIGKTHWSPPFIFLFLTSQFPGPRYSCKHCNVLGRHNHPHHNVGTWTGSIRTTTTTRTSTSTTVTTATTATMSTNSTRTTTSPITTHPNPTTTTTSTTTTDSNTRCP